MADWSAQQYLKFKNQRTQPAFDLAKRITVKQPRSILDIGCGPGNSTAVLKKIFPNAHITGIDSSENMIKKAKESYTDMEFRLCDVTTESSKLGTYDVIFSNACLQWIPNHKEFIPSLFKNLNKDGMLAVQMPMNGQEPLFEIISEIIAEPQWNPSFVNTEPNKTLLPEEYFDILSSCSEKFDIWETVYYHNMPSVEAMVEWVKGTRLRPYLAVLDSSKAESLEKEITKRACSAYSARSNGEFIFKFRRFFFTAVKAN